jgi:hypothetical protein
MNGPSGSFTIAATTEQGVEWSAETAIPGATLDMRQGILTSAQQPVTITLTDPEGLAGWVYVKFGGGGIIPVQVFPPGP